MIERLISSFQFLREEQHRLREPDLPTLCDALKDKWHLPHEEYNMFVSARERQTLQIIASLL